MPNFSEFLPVPYCDVTATCVSPNTYPSVKSVFPVREHVSLEICARGNTYHGETHITVTSQILDNGGISIWSLPGHAFLLTARKLCWRFFFCFLLHCSDERISESQIAGLLRIRPNERIFTIDLRPNTASYSSVLWNASKLFYEQILFHCMFMHIHLWICINTAGSQHPGQGVWSLSVDTDERNIFLCCNTALLY